MPSQVTPAAEVRRGVEHLLTSSEAFKALPPAKQQQVARDTAMVAGYLAQPEGFDGNKLPPARAMDDPQPNAPTPEATWDQRQQAVKDIGDSKFEAGAASEGTKQMALLVKQVPFAAFVGGLIENVFQAIVKSSIQQMDAYSNMIASVAKSLEQFMSDNVTPNQGRDQLVDMFPDTFKIGVDDMADDPAPKLQLKDGVDEADALKKVRSRLTFTDGAPTSMDLSDENVETALVTAARMQMAKQRQQLMASLVLMGINRIVVTDGRISAKVMYDFQAHDSRKLSRSAAAYDYARDEYGNVQSTRAGSGTYDRGYDSSHDKDGSSSATAYAKGDYKYEDKPVMTAMSTASETSDANLQLRAQLAGSVEVNFKSDYLPLDKMATPGMIAAIQGNSTPVDPNVVPSARSSAPAAGAAAPAAATTAPAQAAA